MARMYPRTLLPEDVKSKAETQLFERLREDLSDDWDVFHSAGWMRRDHAEGSTDGEIDFVLAHPEKGLICLEVKGGGIECRHGEWFRIVGGKEERARDPFQQALDHRYDLKRKIEAVDGWKTKKLFLVHALAFPDISVHKLVLGPDAPPEIVIDRTGVQDLATAIENVLTYHEGSRDKRGALGEEGVEMLRNLLAPEVRIEVPMAAEFLEEEAALITLTSQQTKLLSHFGRDKRMVVSGCAGSGKTMLAVERAKRLAANGKDVLFVCFNRALREHLRDREGSSGVHFQNFHPLCIELGHKAKLDMPDYPKGETPQSYWDEELPEKLVDAIEAIGPQYDAIFVDEAQDLHNHWLDALLCTLREPDEDLVWLFMDENQRVFGAELQVPKEYRPFDLTVNCRNTQAIHREVLKKYKGEIEPDVVGPEGRELELLQTDNQPATVAAVLEQLCGEEEVVPQDVVVLSSHSFKKSKVASDAKPAGLTLQENPEPIGPYIRFSSIRAFKGLEAPVVILCELEDLDEESKDEQLYVAISRAKNHCVIVAPQ
jgi:hypothetical protein